MGGEGDRYLRLWARRLDAVMARWLKTPIDQDGGLAMLRAFLLLFTGELSGSTLRLSA